MSWFESWFRKSHICYHPTLVSANKVKVLYKMDSKHLLRKQLIYLMDHKCKIVHSQNLCVYLNGFHVHVNFKWTLGRGLLIHDKWVGVGQRGSSNQKVILTSCKVTKVCRPDVLQQVTILSSKKLRAKKNQSIRESRISF